ncbi:hypothetical protein J2S43_003302 [Catenuloplanes nepalensis]|uniref:Uncharacterized protein n=1 Tax=Catenuloplanes nepalensis TaxID=587533 RepID=A0ABT9MTQ1_9ACTN|nr:hypothetical protein [Catenuloplanes nepalensis]MDP9794790.1 hypothetical protein [Catenuloplanes nepalensis]
MTCGCSVAGLSRPNGRRRRGAVRTCARCRRWSGPSAIAPHVPVTMTGASSCSVATPPGTTE